MKAIAYLVLVLICIVLAVVLLVKLWNVFVSSGPAEQDVQILANVIDDMLEKDDPYLQVPMLLRLDGERIVGFDNPADKDVVVGKITYATAAAPGAAPTPQFTTTATILRGNCGDGACLCAAEGEKTHDCVQLTKPKQIKAIYLVTNYGPYEDLVDTKYSPKEYPATMPAELQGKDTKFLIDVNQVRGLQIVDKTAPRDGPQAVAAVRTEKSVLAVLVEKQLVKGGTEAIIRILPDTDQARSRAYYLQTCTKGEKESDVCVGETFVSSLKQNGNTWSACSPNGFSTSCIYDKVPLCEINEMVTGPCVCSGKIVYSGVCLNSGTTVEVNCDLVTTCESYCVQDGNKDCSATEKDILCPLDPCNIGDQDTRCIQRTGNEQGFFEKIWPDSANRLCMTQKR